MLKTSIIAGIFSCILSGSLSIASEQPESPQQFATFSECQLTSGQLIAPCRVGYRTYGAPNSDRSNTILVPTWAGGTSAEHAYLASTSLLDPEVFFVVIIDALANGVSISPSNSETQPAALFPIVTITDMVETQHRVLTELLDVRSLHGIVGLSMGGMQALEWAVRYPDLAKRTVAAIGSPRLPAYDIAFWTTRNHLLVMHRKCQCKEVLEALTGLGMLMSVPTKLSQDMAREDTQSTIALRSEPDSMGMKKSWDMQRQGEAMISHNIARKFDDDMQKASDVIVTKFLIIVGEDDRIVTPQPARDFAALIGETVLELDHDCGHGEPWCAKDEFADAIRTFMNAD